MALQVTDMKMAEILARADIMDHLEIHSHRLVRLIKQEYDYIAKCWRFIYKILYRGKWTVSVAFNSRIKRTRCGYHRPRQPRERIERHRVA